MRLHYFQHVSFEGLGSVETWAKDMAYDITSTRFFASDTLPDLDDIDWLVIMGGPMSVDEETRYPWIVKEKNYIEQAIVKGKVVLGICFGAQLIADVIGAKIYPNKHKEIGWFPINKTDDSNTTRLADFLPEQMDVFHWHGDTFNTPPGATNLATSQACENQGFIYDDHVIGLQFHLETTPLSAKALIDNCGEEIVEGPYIQSSSEIFSDKQRFEKINRTMEGLLDHMAYLSRTSLPPNSLGVRTIKKAKQF